MINPTIENEGYITSVDVTSYEIKGFSEPNSALQVRIIDRNKIFLLKETNVNSAGGYSLHFDVSSLADGYLTIEVVLSSDQANFNTKKIIKDTSGPNTEIHTNDNVTQSSISSYRVEGKTEPYSEVTISVKDLNNGAVVTNIEADLSGMFASTLNLTPLMEGELSIEVFSKDKLGNKGNLAEQKITKTSSTYVLTHAEQQRWNISNNGTSPVETTKGFNDALAWANQNNFTTFVVPAGTYLIRKGEPNDPTARINMVSNMTFLLEDGAILQKETNGKEHYDLLYVGAGIQNVTLQGGIYRGDKDTHDYSQKDNPYTAGTHESGYGIRVVGAANVFIEYVISEKFTGDGLVIGGTGQLVSEFYKESFESGSVNDSGVLIPDTTKIRIKHKEKANFNNTIFQTIKTFQLSNPKFISKSIPYDIYFYRENNSFIQSVKNKKIGWDYIDFPAEASYFYAVFHTNSIPNGIYIEYWAKSISKNIVVNDSEFAFNRRQGITVGGADNVLISNNKIHDIKGIAPQSGIDLEGGIGENGHLNNNVHIKDNYFFNNQVYDLILFDGQNAIVEGNHFGSRGVIGLAISTPFTGAIIKSNKFDGTRIIAYHDATFLNNEMIDSSTFFEGPNIKIKDMLFTDSLFSISSKIPFGVEVDNVTIICNKKNDSGMSLSRQPIHIKNVTIQGQSILRSFSGNVLAGCIFDNLNVIGFNSTYGLDLPQGTYNNCSFEAADGSRFGSPSINRDGKYIFNNCSFVSNHDGAVTLLVTHVNSEVEIRDSVFEVFSNAPAISVQTTKYIKIESNQIIANNLTSTAAEIIKINDYWQRNNPYDVLAASIEYNTITSNLSAIGISTIYAGTGAPPYYVKNNILYNAKLQLKTNDINENNQELTK